MDVTTVLLHGDQQPDSVGMCGEVRLNAGQFLLSPGLIGIMFDVFFFFFYFFTPSGIGSQLINDLNEQ